MSQTFPAENLKLFRLNSQGCCQHKFCIRNLNYNQNCNCNCCFSFRVLSLFYSRIISVDKFVLKCSFLFYAIFLFDKQIPTLLVPNFFFELTPPHSCFFLSALFVGKFSFVKRAITI